MYSEHLLSRVRVSPDTESELDTGFADKIQYWQEQVPPVDLLQVVRIIKEMTLLLASNSDTATEKDMMSCRIRNKEDVNKTIWDFTEPSEC